MQKKLSNLEKQKEKWRTPYLTLNKVNKIIRCNILHKIVSYIELSKESVELSSSLNGATVKKVMSLLDNSLVQGRPRGSRTLFTSTGKVINPHHTTERAATGAFYTFVPEMWWIAPKLVCARMNLCQEAVQEIKLRWSTSTHWKCWQMGWQRFLIRFERLRGIHIIIIFTWVQYQIGTLTFINIVSNWIYWLSQIVPNWKLWA